MNKAIQSLLGRLGPEIDHLEEEVFLLFSKSIPSQNLGFIDPKAASLDLTINGRHLTIAQSPTLLSSNRAGGTTGAAPARPGGTAVVWKITPLIASWLGSPANLFFDTSILTPASAVLELGCGVSALVGLALGPRVCRYTLSDQPYVARLVGQNLAQNRPDASPPPSSGAGATASSAAMRRRARPAPASSRPTLTATENVLFRTLDWEVDMPTHSLTGSDEIRSFDLVLACDCIYNEPLVGPFVQTCLDVCALRQSEPGQPPCVCVVAQQLRDPAVFEAWLSEFSMRGFRVWMVPDEELPDGLRSDSGFVVHVGILKQ